MNIIIIGDGKVGYSLAENLSREDHDVIIIDKDADALKKASENLDVICIKGSGVSTKILIEAGVANADLLIAATTSDEMNMVCCLTGKKLGARHTIARIRDPGYANELNGLMADLGLDMVINPEQASANEIAHLLRFPAAIKIESFTQGQVDIVEIRVTTDMPIVGMKLSNISSRLSSSILIGIIVRQNEIIIPNGKTVIMEDDTIHIIGKTSGIFHFCKSIGIITTKINNVMIVGGGRIAVYLTNLIHEMGMKVKIIEKDLARCIELSELLPNALIIHGDGTDEDFLHSENAGDMDAFVATTGRDEENLMTCMMVKNFKVQKVIAKVTRMNYGVIVKNLGIDNIISPKSITTNSILKFVRGLKNAQGSTIQTLHRFLGGKVVAIEFFALSSSTLLDIPLKKINMVGNTLVAAITRGNTHIVPHGNDRIRQGDSVVVITRETGIKNLDGILSSGGMQIEYPDSLKILGDRPDL